MYIMKKWFVKPVVLLATELSNYNRLSVES